MVGTTVANCHNSHPGVSAPSTLLPLSNYAKKYAVGCASNRCFDTRVGRPDVLSPLTAAVRTQDGSPVSLAQHPTVFADNVWQKV